MPKYGAHLSEFENEFGTGSGSHVIRDLVGKGIALLNENSQKERVASKGTDLKENPHVSDAGKCPRQVYFSLRNIPKTEPLTTDSLVNFGVGHAVEEWLTKALEVQGAGVIREARIEIPVDGTVVSGRVDFLVTLPEFHSIVELKSINSRSMGFTLRKQEPGKDDHRRQLNLYLHAAAQEQLEGGPFDKGYLIYVVKDATKGEPPLHAFEVAYNKNIAEADLLWLARLKKQADAKSDPGIPTGYTKSKYPCNYCGWQSYCHGPK